MNQVNAESAAPARGRRWRIVNWTPEEEDLLREQVNIYGTDCWTKVATKFKGKTARQCKRRWNSYLNTDFRKGVWTPAEDMLLCEAQKKYGNKWTEIAKVVLGRTDNAVKNRFNNLCKKRAIYQAPAKDKSSGSLPKKLSRADVSSSQSSCSNWDEPKNQADPLKPLAEENGKTEGTFLKTDDPKRVALMQQADLLNSLSEENPEQSLGDACKVIENSLRKSKENGMVKYTVFEKGSNLSAQLEDLMKELRSGKVEIHSSQRQPDMHDSPISSEYSNGSTMSTDASESPNHEEIPIPCVEPEIDEDISALLLSELVSPSQTTPLFKIVPSIVPSPQFSESERHFLMKTLGIESSPSNSNITNSSQTPCRRALFHGL